MKFMQAIHDTKLYTMQSNFHKFIINTLKHSLIDYHKDKISDFMKDVPPNIKAYITIKKPSNNILTPIINLIYKIKSMIAGYKYLRPHVKIIMADKSLVQKMKTIVTWSTILFSGFLKWRKVKRLKRRIAKIINKSYVDIQKRSEHS